MNYTKYPKGSEWRKWDLHVHTPDTKLSDQYNIDNGDNWEYFCERIEESDVSVFGVTDYFSAENYFTFIDKFKTKYPHSKKVFFPNIEMRLEVSVGRNANEVNIHVIFSDEVKQSEIEKFLSGLKTTQSRNGATVSCKDLSSNEFQGASIRHGELRRALESVFGNNICYLLIAASNDLRPEKDGPPRKLNITDEIDKVCDAFFGGNQNVEYFLKTE